VLTFSIGVAMNQRWPKGSRRIALRSPCLFRRAIDARACGAGALHERVDVLHDEHDRDARPAELLGAVDAFLGPLVGQVDRGVLDAELGVADAAVLADVALADLGAERFS
jgi:hypothetical protein